MIDFIEEMSQDFLDYCYQTNVERAFPAIDGLKPGQRACLYEMYRKGYTPNKPHVKSAKVAGGVIADLWPHGDTAIYETFARMSQPFVNNIPLCEFHGSNGNQIIPEAAASRYTEVRLSKIGLEMFNGIKKKNVPFILNFDETVEWPEVLPCPLPILMINGSEGIGTTIAQKWLPYDLLEVSEAYAKYIATGEMDYSLCPSFPSGGIIINKNELSTILKTGKGKVVLRARAEINKQIITVTEICYQTCVRDLMEEFKDLYEADELPGIADIQNMSGKNGVNIRIICEKNADPHKVLQMLYKKTNLQKTYSANQNLLINKVPQLVNTETYFKLLYKHNEECLIRECNFDKEKAEIRKEECEGLLIAIANIDEIIEIVRGSENKEKAKVALIERWQFINRQADCVLKMTIGQLTKLDGFKVKEELNNLISTISNINEILENKNLRNNILVENIRSLLSKYKSVRKTELTNIEIKPEDKEIAFVEPEKCVVIMSEGGLVKRIPSSSFRVQKRNGKGVKTKDDIVSAVIRTNTIDSLMVFTNKGKMYRILVDNIPAGTNATKGQPIQSFIEMEANEKPTLIYSIYRDTDANYVLFVTKNGLVKKTSLEEYIKTKKKTGIAAITIKDGDSLASVNLIKDEDIILVTKAGMCIRFSSGEITTSSRTTMGMKGINLAENDEVIAALPVRHEDDQIAIITEKGLGKKFAVNEIIKQKRAGKGLICYKPTDTSGKVADATLVSDEDSILIVGLTNSICISAKDIPMQSRVALGNQLIKSSKVTSITKV